MFTGGMTQAVFTHTGLAAFQSNKLSSLSCVVQKLQASLIHQRQQLKEGVASSQRTNQVTNSLGLKGLPDPLVTVFITSDHANTVGFQNPRSFYCYIGWSITLPASDHILNDGFPFSVKNLHPEFVFSGRSDTDNGGPTAAGIPGGSAAGG